MHESASPFFVQFYCQKCEASGKETGIKEENLRHNYRALFL